ncbi:MAG: pterin-4-alpha-carbinolamine dehydratase [Curvibacter sp. GWA2_64_110]|nr:MAG: pterin-4-alpha-carbinolamine dehydratase [Curvibacter sp. GWA2_64_110]HCY14468.1 4a-hydroxytetrahydrobiopterin dehydratase [Curvibacter sp.]
MNTTSKPNQAPGHINRALTATEIVANLAHLEGWSLSGDGVELAIQKRFDFPDFHQSMAFANAVAYIAQRQDHHPELVVAYRHCTVRWRSHDAGGITRADFDCSAQIDALLR